MFTILILLLFVALGLAIYWGWIKFSSGNVKGHPDLTVSMDLKKMEADKDKAKEGIAGITHKSSS